MRARRNGWLLHLPIPLSTPTHLPLLYCRPPEPSFSIVLCLTTPAAPLPLLQASSEIADDVQLHSLMSKIALLCLHFPRLRLIWSRSLHATADMFHQLKANQDDPDPITGRTLPLR